MILKSNNEPIYLTGAINLNRGFLIKNHSKIDNRLVYSLFKPRFNTKDAITLSLDYAATSGINLTISDGQINIREFNNSNIALGLIQLRSLLETSFFQRNQIIKDSPKYDYRELMLDLANKHLSIDEIKIIIRQIALNRYNYLHLNLFSNNHYIIESNDYSILNGQQYYSKEEISDIIDYASFMGITIVPEIDILRFTNCVLNNNDDDFQLLKRIEIIENLLSEIIFLFPSDYFHIGCKENNLFYSKITPKTMCNDDYHLFIETVSKMISKQRKKVIAWDDILKYGEYMYVPIIQRWNKSFDINSDNNYQYIISSNTDTYFDYPYSLTPLKNTYEFTPKGYDNFGLSAHIWTDLISDEQDLEKLLFPRIQAFGENAWSYKLDYKDFLERLKLEIKQFERYEIDYTPIDQVDIVNINNIKLFLKDIMAKRMIVQNDYLTLLKILNEFKGKISEYPVKVMSRKIKK